MEGGYTQSFYEEPWLRGCGGISACQGVLLTQKDLQESLDAQTQADYGMSAVDWFKSQDVTLSFQ